MIFKKVPYRLGKGKNIHGRFDGDRFKILYLSSDDGDVVKSKVVRRRAGYVEVTKGEEEFEAIEVVPLGGVFFASRGEKNVKVVKYL